MPNNSALIKSFTAVSQLNNINKKPLESAKMRDYVEFNIKEYERWLNDYGDTTLRLDYNLGPDSVVVDAGGYTGQWAEDINRRYNSTVHIFEPISTLCEGIASRFNNNRKVIVHKYALGRQNCELNISVNSDSSSTFDFNAEKTETIRCIDVKRFFESAKIDKVDLLKINIEGGEYDLLERLIELDILNMISNLQIQFHRFIPDCMIRRKDIQTALSATHEQNWNYDWIWENWKKIK